MIIGTNHFDSKWSAYAYYAEYGYSRQYVDQKISSGEIRIGKPILKDGETLYMNGKEGRFFIETKEV